MWTARLGTVHAAARHLHLTQPAISHRIRDLEEELGIQLFERQSQRLLVTELGRNVLVYAERVLASAQDMARLDLRRTITGLVRMGVDESCAIIGMPQILKDIKDCYPALRVDLTVGGGAQLLQKINNHELDMALHTGQSSQPDVTSQFIGLTEHQWVAAHDLMMPDEDFLPAHALNHRIVCNAPPSTLHESASRWLASDGYSFEEYSSCNSLSLMVALVASGHAIAMLPASITRRQVAEKSCKFCAPSRRCRTCPTTFRTWRTTAATRRRASWTSCCAACRTPGSSRPTERPGTAAEKALRTTVGF